MSSCMIIIGDGYDVYRTEWVFVSIKDGRRKIQSSTDHIEVLGIQYYVSIRGSRKNFTSGQMGI